MKKAIVIITFILAFTACIVAMLKGYPDLRHLSVGSYIPSAAEGPNVNIDDITWTRVVDWRFTEGLYPGGWSWGAWRITNGLLRGTDYTGDSAVYFFPFTHGGDVILETKLKLQKPLGDSDVAAYLLTRDSEVLNYESGMVLFGSKDHVAVRHMAKSVEYISEMVPTYATIEYNRWYIMRFMIRGNVIKAFLNGTQLFASDWHLYTGSHSSAIDQKPEFLPVGNYREPHISVVDGTVDFEYVRVYIAN